MLGSLCSPAMGRACGVTRRVRWPRGAETSCAFDVAGKQQVGLRPKETTMWYRAVGCIVTLILSLLAAPLAARAQVRQKTPRVGVLEPGSQQRPFPCLLAFQQGLRGLGYMEGHNIFLEYRYAEHQPDRLPALAAELVQRQPDTIWTSSSSAAQALKQATTT